MQVISYRLFLFVLLFCPLAFGTVEYWSLATFEIVTSLSFLLLGIFWFSEVKSSYKVPGILPLFLLLGWMLFQLLPLPPAFVQFISPATFEIYRPLLEIDSSPGWIPLTLNPKATLLSLLKFSSYGLFYIMTVYHLCDSERLKKTVAIVTVLGVVIAVEAILQKLTSPDAIYWLRSAPSSTPIGPWVYSNHFAGFMEMLFPLVVALFLFYRPRVHYEKNMRERFVALLTMPGSNRYLLLGTGAVLMAVSILLSISRGGIITLCIAFLFFTFLSARITQNRQIRWGIILAALVVLMITWLGWDPIMAKFSTIWGEHGLNTSGRLPVFQDSLNIIGAFPLSGTGFGTFIDVYPSYRTVLGDSIFDHAHNDYVELLADGGLVGFVLCAWFLYSIPRDTIRTLLKRREQYSILITIGALTGMLALLLHCFVDFQMYNGANGLYFFFLCGLAVSGAHTRLQYRTRPSFLKKTNAKKAILVPTVLAVAVLTASTWHTLGMYQALRSVAPMQSIFLNRHIPSNKLMDIHTTFPRAARLDPLEAGYRYRQGHVSTFLHNKDQARNEFLQAGRLSPMSGLYIQQIGLSLPSDQKVNADTLLALGLERERLVLERYLAYADWFIKNEDRSKAIEVLKQAFQAVPYRSSETAKFVFTRGFNRADIKQILPRHAAAWHEMGRIMEQSNNLAEAEYYYLQTLDYFDIHDVVPAYFTRLYTLYRREQKQEKALAILRMGVEYIPDYSWFRIQLGDYYLSKGIPYRAKEEYQQGLQFDPDNRALRKKLEDLE